MDLGSFGVRGCGLGLWRAELGLGSGKPSWASGLTACEPPESCFLCEVGEGLCHSVDGSREGLVWMGEAWM